MKIAFITAECELLGVEYLSSVLKMRGHSTKLFFDPVLFQGQYIRSNILSKVFDYNGVLMRRLQQYKPDVVALSVITPLSHWALNVAKHVKAAMSVPVVFGGIHPTTLPEHVLQHSCVDFVVRGEGEYALADLVDALAEKKKDFDIKNIWYKKGTRIFKNEVRPLCEDLDSLPLPDKQFFYEEACKQDDYTIMTGRGCPHSCSYCNSSYMKELYRNKGSFIRKRSVANVIHELEYAKKNFKPKIVIFDDELLTYDIKWLDQFSSIYEKKIGLMSFCWVSPNSITAQSVRCLKRLSCYSVEMGVQTLNERIRREILHRYYSNEQVADAIKILQKNRIKCITEYIFGLPQERVGDYRQIIDFHKRARADKVNVYMLRLFPKTKIIEKMNFDAQSRQQLNGETESPPFTMIGKKNNPQIQLYQSAILLLNILPPEGVEFLLEKKMTGILKFFGAIYTFFNGILWFGNPFEYIQRWICAGSIVFFRKVGFMRYVKYPAIILAYAVRKKFR
ncbi:MAG: radical SAM protein [Candidatus Omnitrophota bacterium]